MSKINHPRHGSLMYWPRKRSRHTIARIRTWPAESKVKLLGFIGYKAGMTHIQVIDNYAKSMTKGETLNLPTTIIECPPMVVAGVAFYAPFEYGLRKVASVLAPKLDPIVARTIQLPKQTLKSVDSITEFTDLRLLVYSTAKDTTIGNKKPALMEISLGGSKEDKLKYAKEVLGKEIKVSDVFDLGNSVDVHGISKGKGFQGTVKRYGVPIRQHKAEKVKRGIATLGPWSPKRIDYTVAQPGKMGFHSRTEYNKQILKIGTDGEEINPKGGLNKYGLIRQTYLLVKGSVVGPQKRAIVMTPSSRPNYKMTKEAPEITFISK